MTAYIGIDPGLDGGIAILSSDGDEVFATPTVGTKPRQYLEAQMRGLLMDAQAGRHVIASIEEQSYRPGQAVRSTFSTGLGWGIWRGMLSALGIPYEIVPPKVWRAAAGLPQKADPKSKGDSIAAACRLFPALADELVGPRGGFRDGPAEALLIAYALRKGNDGR